MTIPRVAHFVFGLKEQDRPFHLVHYLALESCRRILRPEAIYLHYKHLPYGVYWDLIRPHLTLREVSLVPEVTHGPAASPLIPARYQYAHHADFIRLDALIEFGGIYADIDTLFVRPLPPELHAHPFVIGREYPVADERTGSWRPSLCNAVLMAEPGAEFAVTWRRRMGAALNGTWSNHSGFLAEELSQRMPREVHIEPPRSFYRYGPNPADLALLLEGQDADAGEVLSIHLWSHLWWDASRRDYSEVHAGLLTDRRIRCVDSTYNLLARPFVPELQLW
jgi:Glycosyltransferase sugar-binding region containing DXD motif